MQCGKIELTCETIEPSTPAGRRLLETKGEVVLAVGGDLNAKAFHTATNGRWVKNENICKIL